jgi:hypothetical protein
MASHPINLALRFLLELAALFSLGYWGWTQNQGVLRFALGIGLPLLAAVLWGTFRVPGDASASGKAPVPTPGPLRLILELAFFGAAVWALYDAGLGTWATALGLLVLLHYIASYDRIAWLLRR